MLIKDITTLIFPRPTASCYLVNHCEVHCG